MKEILCRLETLKGRAFFKGTPTKGFDIEKMKFVLESMCQESNVQVLLHHSLVAAKLDGRQLTHAVLESKSGRQAIEADIFIDCTGDGDLAARSGCSFQLGAPQSGKTQPMSLLALVAGINPEEIKGFFRYGQEIPWNEPKDRLRKAMEKAGGSPSYAMPSLFWIRDDLFSLMANHEYGRSAICAKDLSDATIKARCEINSLVNGLVSLGGIWKNLHLVATAAHIGVREGRRIKGLYEVTTEDMKQGRSYDDAVCKVSFGIDVHSPDKTEGKGIVDSGVKTQPYDIPLRALIAADVNGLMMAGRCISGDFLAHSSYRVTGNAVTMGEATGRVAAAAVLTCKQPQEICWQEL